MIGHQRIRDLMIIPNDPTDGTAWGQAFLRLLDNIDRAMHGNEDEPASDVLKANLYLVIALMMITARNDTTHIRFNRMANYILQAHYGNNLPRPDDPDVYSLFQGLYEQPNTSRLVTLLCDLRKIREPLLTLT